ncbi:hypothetical protein K450DRAFT_257592 [Umbelopsis ramanniana AG]|uniref:Heme haloperoxidase family profile domain-containing protein n=1 Tax=Umbelopsis ramanniana AG TaxID=1314678 RepID=A0AAD5E4R3_UMBRA|nr:uncharacterized protein K450DRAFT_257592 [Umbelopsis ramanniana AG]KAI8576296.1 hypothetical protein K450DRAFT_257592 [Umbelopsis ramanniana AG]
MADAAQRRPHPTTPTINTGRMMMTRFLIMGVVFLAMNVSKMFKTDKDVVPLTAETWPQYIAEHPYQGKGPVTNRSPCPMLNTLANHGILNNSGKDITKKQLIDALTRLNLGPQFGVLFTEGVFWMYHDKKALPDWISQLSTLDLAQLQKHNAIEHDVSYTRQDFDVAGDDASADPNLIFQFTQFANETGYIDLAQAGNARRLRELQSKRDNPDLVYNLFYKFFGSGSECALLLNVIGRNMAVSVDHFNKFFKEERFPDDWTPPEENFSFVRLTKATYQCYQSWSNSKETLAKEKQIEASQEKVRLVQQQ